MPSLDDIVAAAAGEERDALRRAMAEDIEALRSGGGGPGFVRAERPADLARALGRDRRAQAPRRARS
ncbi:hypothetical protein C0214_08950 [Methylobacterium sp. DM1]|uniref:Uncharacterized protein n=1 Tax=Methylorubrum thiocyanatum TaxID=47958 RepID=A0AA40VC49_9HYPH|nr:hypothetical protein C0214_08950 [Methylobacterium sp. DM1]MBA8914954.1 hypothetical protein [Methylorubrum thiocyanatum]GJE79361.1 hypothetical protein CJNNKLLH_0687 [Methylorubrum thiocyanatum]